MAELSVRFARVRLRPPGGKPHLKPLRVWAILTKEEAAPVGVESLEWMLLSSLPVADFEQAVEKIAWYIRRWGIEIYHRILKSGRKIEERQLGSADRIEACLAVDMIVAWRIFHLTKLGRETPDVPCTVYFEEAQWKALAAYVTRHPIPPPQPPSLREATRMMASLGGFLGRKCDKEPGAKSLWMDYSQKSKNQVIGRISFECDGTRIEHEFSRLTKSALLNLVRSGQLVKQYPESEEIRISRDGPILVRFRDAKQEKIGPANRQKGHLSKIQTWLAGLEGALTHLTRRGR